MNGSIHDRTSELVPRVSQQSPGAHRVHLSDAPVSGLETAGTASGLSGWWLGQAGFALRHPAGTLLVDPYLSDSLGVKYAGTRFPHTRLHESPVAPANLRGIGLVLHSHAHTDHLDPWTVRGLLDHNDPSFVAPRARRDVALERHVPERRLLAVTAGDEIEVAGVRVLAVPAAHEELTVDAAGDHVFLGFVIEVGGTRVYHSGDCAPYDGQSDLLAALDVDVALLPVNGRDAWRRDNGVPGNFTVEEAVRLCQEAGIPELVCHHFGLFDFNTVPPASLCQRLSTVAGDLAWTIPAVGAGFHITKDAA
jgi:L-ascorbate metabolism protein UlaG (beta-lactamase superfamily)